MGTTASVAGGPELLVELRPGGRRMQLEDQLRKLVRAGRLAAGARLPSSRALAEDLRVSRRLVVEAYAQLVAEGYFTARQGDGTYVAANAAAGNEPLARTPPGKPRFDFFPGAPDLESFPRTLWLRALREVLNATSAQALAYPDVRGMLELRSALAAHLRRVRGVVASPDSIVICSGATQGLALLARALQRLGRKTIAVEDPSLPMHRALLEYAGLKVPTVPVDEQGACVDRLDAEAVVVTPAHQFPTGVALSAERRAALLAWAADGGIVIEDDYDAEFRYDRAPLGALQGLSPEQVVYLGTVSKTLAPGLRLGWLVLPSSLMNAVVEAKLNDDCGCPTLEQLTLARLIDSAAYDRELRKARRRNRARRDALLAAVRLHMPQAQPSGISAGLHLVLRLAKPLDAQRLWAKAAERSVGIYPMSFHMRHVSLQTDALVIGYAGLSEASIEQGVRLLAEAIEEM